MDTLIQIADAALAGSYARAGSWMACRPGCDPCCHGVFAINALDVQRLLEGLAQVAPEIAAGIRQRAADARARLSPTFPGFPHSGELFAAETSEARQHHEQAFEEWGNDEPCPVLDPATHTCSLYQFRPMPCRTFGPPMPNAEGGLGVCELCFQGAPSKTVSACAVDAGFLDVEASLLESSGDTRQTVIAFALP